MAPAQRDGGVLPLSSPSGSGTQRFGSLGGLSNISGTQVRSRWFLVIIMLAIFTCVLAPMIVVSMVMSVSPLNAAVKSLQLRGTSRPASAPVLVSSATIPSFLIWTAPKGEDHFVSATVAHDHMWERTETELIQSLLKPACSRNGEGVFVDVGAHIGWYSMVAASLGCRVFAFEPQPRARRLFNMSITTNGFEDRMAIFDRPVWDTHTPLEFVEAEGNWGASRVRQEVAANAGLAIVMPVALDDLLDPSNHVTLMKIDVEGQELHILRSAAKLLSKPGGVQHIMLEFSPSLMKQGTAPQLLELLDDIGCAVTIVSAPGATAPTVLTKPRFARFAEELQKCGLDCHANLWCDRTGFK